MRIVCLSKRGLTFAQLTPPQQAAVWQWMWHEGGFETEAQAKQSCLRCRYKVEDIPIQQVMAVWRRVAGTSGLAGFGVEKTDKHWNGTAARVSKIQKTNLEPILFLKGFLSAISSPGWTTSGPSRYIVHR